MATNTSKFKFLGLALAVLTLCSVGSSPGWAQMRRMPPTVQGVNQRDPLAFLKRAIQQSGAEALSSAQEQQLTSLFQSHRESLKAAGPDAAVQAARQALDDAILSGDSQKAKAAADTLASAMANNLPGNLEAQADFEIQVVGILQPQLGALEQHMGKAGVIRLLRSLTGRPGGPGPLAMNGFRK